jgi:hypothetical protein
MRESVRGWKDRRREAEQQWKRGEESYTRIKEGKKLRSRL